MNEGEGEASYFYSDDVPATGETPEWFKSDKYKTVSDQAKAYVDAEKRLGEMGDKIKSFSGAPEAYEASLPEGVSIDTEDPLFAAVQEWGKSINLGQDGYSELINRYAEVQGARQAAEEEAFNEMRSGIENIDAREQNINDFLGANDMEALTNIITSEEELVQFEKLLGLAGKASVNVDGDANNLPSQEEIDRLMFEKDEHGVQMYGRNKERTEKVRKMLERLHGTGDYHKQVG